ncbi:MAG: FliM/FliN family flagellar motor switch protein, partial [Melioribacteraceae bacterium]
DLAFLFVDKLLGGSGMGSKQVKVITPIEQKVLRVIVDRIMYDLKKSWQTIDTMDFVLERFEQDIDFAQITSQSESVLLISFELMIGEQSFLINLCFATFAFDNILAKMTSQKLSSIRATKYYGITSKEVVTNHLVNTKIPIQVEFGNSSLSVNELMNLEKGDIIMLNTKVDDDHKIRTGSRLLFTGRYGSMNNHKAIKITDRILDEKQSL